MKICMVCNDSGSQSTMRCWLLSQSRGGERATQGCVEGCCLGAVCHPTGQLGSCLPWILPRTEQPMGLPDLLAVPEEPQSHCTPGAPCWPHPGCSWQPKDAQCLLSRRGHPAHPRDITEGRPSLFLGAPSGLRHHSRLI